MIDQFNDKVKDTMKPLTELATLNMTTMQEVIEKQNELFTKILNEGASVVEQASKENDVMGAIEAHKAFITSLQETITSSAQETYNIVTNAQQQAGTLLKSVGDELTSGMPEKSK